jgi:signal peptidase II
MTSYRWLFWLLAFTGLALDQGSKYGIFSHLYNHGFGGEITVIDNYFTIETVYDFRRWEDDGSFLYRLRTISGTQVPRVNEGALFGIGRGHNWIFAVVSIAAAGLIIVFSNRAAIRRDLFLSVALGLILAGTLGNFYDRMVFFGVRDFIHWFVADVEGGKKILRFDWPVFNIADCCLVVGAGTLLIHAFFFPEAATSPDATKEQEPAVVQS